MIACWLSSTLVYINLFYFLNAPLLLVLVGAAPGYLINRSDHDKIISNSLTTSELIMRMQSYPLPRYKIKKTNSHISHTLAEPDYLHWFLHRYLTELPKLIAQTSTLIDKVLKAKLKDVSRWLPIYHNHRAAQQSGLWAPCGQHFGELGRKSTLMILKSNIFNIVEAEEWV